MEEVGVGPLPRPSGATAQLVELAQAEAVRSVDHQGVHRGHVDAGLDDRGAHEHVELALPELEDHLLERALVHLPVGHGDARLGHELAQLTCLVLDVAHPVVHEEDLALAQQLPADGLGHGAVVVLADVGEDRLALGGRGVQQGEVSDAGEAHLERARDRGGRQGQHVDLVGELLDLLLVGDAEPLLLVDDEQAQVLELDVVGEEPVRADDAVDLAGARPRRPPWPGSR